MPLSFVEISAHSAILPAIKYQAAALVSGFRLNPRLSSVFATQQRWLMAHAAILLAFEDPDTVEPRVTLAHFLAAVERHSVASRNTADAFFKEMLHYGYVSPVADTADRRAKPVRITAEPLALLYRWAEIHLMTLDRLDGGQRFAALKAMPRAFGLLEREIATRVLTACPMRQPNSALSLFTWLNNGGVIMDWLIAGLGEANPDGKRYATSVSAVSDIADWVTLSRTHLTRKLREAEAMGSMGWTGKRGASTMWVSADFVCEVVYYQAAKLAIVDAACERALMR